MITLDESNREELESQAAAVVHEAQAFTIETDEDAERVGEFLRLRVKAVMKEVNLCFDPLIQSSRAHTKRIRTAKDQILRPLQGAEIHAKRLLQSFFQRRKEEERQARLALEAEAQRKAEAEAIERAVQLEQEGKAEAAEAVIESKPQPVAVAPPPPKPKVAGVSVRSSWGYEITDPEQIKPAFLMPDKVKIGKTVRAMGPDAAQLIGGIVVTEKTTVASRSE